MINVSLTQEHLNEAVDLLSLTTVLAIIFTVVFILYCLSFRLSYAQLRDDHGKIQRQTVYILGLQTVLMICSTLNVVASNRIAQVIFVNNSTLSGGPLGLQATVSVATISHLLVIANIVENLLILGVLLWRVRVVFSGTRFVLPVTIVSLFLYLTSAGLMISYDAITWNIHNTSLAATPRAEAIVLIMRSVFCITSFLFMTSTIIVRLVFIRREHIKLMGKSDVAGQYLGIAAMLTESYALHTLWGIGMLVSFGLDFAPTYDFFNNCVTQVDILANFLVMYRVLSGRAWTRQTNNQLSSLRWTSNGPGTTNSETVDPRQTYISE